MSSTSTDQTRWPKVAAYHYVRNITKRRVLVALYFVLCFFFWRAMKRSFSEGLEFLPKGLHSGESGNALDLPPSCLADIEDSLPAVEPRTWYSYLLHNNFKPQQTEIPPDQGLSKDSENNSELILNRELTNDLAEDGTWKQKNRVKGLVTSPNARRSLKSWQENQVNHQMQQQTLFQGIMDSTKYKISEPSALRTTFPEYSEFVALSTMAGTLPDIIYIPFEAATTDVTLTGWEDEWFSKAEYNVEQWGNLSEPKIDFVYSCESIFEHVLTRY